MAYKTISYGSSGEDVRKLQQTLNSLGFNLSVDGQFGPKTQSAVRSYQQKNGLAVDGIVGVNTWNSLSKSITNKTTTTNKTTNSKVTNTNKTKNKIAEPVSKPRPTYQKKREYSFCRKQISRMGK